MLLSFLMSYEWSNEYIVDITIFIAGAILLITLLFNPEGRYAVFTPEKQYSSLKETRNLEVTIVLNTYNK